MSDIRHEYEQADPHPFALVGISRATIEILKSQPDEGLASHFGDARSAPAILIGIGDGITVNIWETGADTLFSPATALMNSGTVSVGGRGTAIPEQIVGDDGGISVPFAGRIQAAGKTVLQVQAAIEQALAGKAQKPQVLVNVSHPLSSSVTVIGEASAGARIPLSMRGERVLDVLAEAGGPRAATYETRVQLRRDDSSVTIPLLRLIDDPKENIFLHPGDDLVVTREPQSFTVFGATGHSAQINFDAAHLSLIEAVAKSGGLQDERANPRGVYLFRYEPSALAAALAGGSGTKTDGRDIVPVVYQLDLTQANSYFLAQSFEIRDRDVLYVSSAPTNQLQKFLNLLGLLSQPVIQGAVVNSAVK